MAATVAALGPRRLKPSVYFSSTAQTTSKPPATASQTHAIDCTPGLTGAAFPGHLHGQGNREAGPMTNAILFALLCSLLYAPAKPLSGTLDPVEITFLRSARMLLAAAGVSAVRPGPAAA